jgi:hypothetical protein
VEGGVARRREENTGKGKMEENRVKNGCYTGRPISKPEYKNSGLLTQQNASPNSIYHFPVSFFFRFFSVSCFNPSLPLSFTVALYSFLSAELFVAVKVSASKSVRSTAEYFLNVI